MWSTWMFCKQGLVLRADGRCVQPQECPKPPAPKVTCRADEDYYECSPSCKNTCENFNNPGAKCQCGPPGCFCRRGLVLRADGRCVRPQECPKPSAPKVVCRHDEEYYECNPRCRNTCENFNNPEQKCQCGAPGCFCRQGLVLRADGRCVRPEECRKPSTPKAVCREDEDYYECNPSCRNTCENMYNQELKCECGPPGCFCREGLVLRADGRCVQPQECPKPPARRQPPPRCPKNAIYIECGSPCPPTCEDLEPEPCEEKCVQACYCKPGYVKRKDGICVKIETCLPRRRPELPPPPPKCPKNAIFIECGSPCPPTCENRYPTCEEKCTTACYCKPGYLKSKQQGKCVRADQCEPPPVIERCGVDEEYYQCTPSCKNTCENFRNPPLYVNVDLQVAFVKKALSCEPMENVCDQISVLYSAVETSSTTPAHQAARTLVKTALIPQLDVHAGLLVVSAEKDSLKEQMENAFLLINVLVSYRTCFCDIILIKLNERNL
ncbi:uncharacterized protein TNCT_390051 [Trichonephila clavata]|uniref:EGF-like domain-containing protein n=1 Tax=Trichonephila clavata TaxID=2740835 RepID=A0A8X6LK21_TRICU|nr:uncharacterized protein TNCT_390051 [Trichonephila clavata]